MTYLKWLNEHDYNVLESYWFRFKELSKMEVEGLRAENINQILEAISRLYNEGNAFTKDFIDVAYFQTDFTIRQLNYSHIAEQLDVSSYKVKAVRNGLLKDMAEMICWV